MSVAGTRMPVSSIAAKPPPLPVQQYKQAHVVYQRHRSSIRFKDNWKADLAIFRQLGLTGFSKSHAVAYKFLKLKKSLRELSARNQEDGGRKFANTSYTFTLMKFFMCAHYNSSAEIKSRLLRLQYCKKKFVLNASPISFFRPQKFASNIEQCTGEQSHFQCSTNWHSTNCSASYIY